MCRGRQPPLHRGPAPRGRGRLCDHLARGGTSASRGALLVAEFPPHRVARSGAHLRLAPHTKSEGYAPPSILSPELSQIVVAQGSTRLENSSPLTSFYGYDNDVLNAAGDPVMVPTPTSPNDEAQKTEPDKNTYLTFKKGLAGADPSYDYGTHFLFQGHEGGAGGAGYITRINLDANAAHRVSLLATKDVFGNSLATID